MCFVPLSERCCVDLDDSGFGESVCADEFVVGGMEGHRDDTNFASDTLRAPGEVAGIEAEGAEFLVSTAGANKMDTFGADTGICGLTTFLECSDMCQI